MRIHENIQILILALSAAAVFYVLNVIISYMAGR